MESTAAATADELSKLEDEGLAAHQKYCQQQQLAREEAELLEQGQQKLLSLRLATDGAHSSLVLHDTCFPVVSKADSHAEKQRQCDKEDKQLEQLKAALAKAGLPGEARAIRESNKRIETQVQACKDRCPLHDVTITSPSCCQFSFNLYMVKSCVVCAELRVSNVR